MTCLWNVAMCVDPQTRFMAHSAIIVGCDVRQRAVVMCKHKNRMYSLLTQHFARLWLLLIKL